MTDESRTLVVEPIGDIIDEELTRAHRRASPTILMCKAWLTATTEVDRRLSVTNEGEASHRIESLRTRQLNASKLHLI